MRLPNRRHRLSTSCICCGRPISEDPIAGNRVVFLGHDGDTRECGEVAFDEAADVLAAGWAVCWNCRIVEPFLQMPQDAAKTSWLRYIH